MPGFTTHYLFGQQTYQHLRRSELKQNLQKYHHVFCLGLQGPDIFFYELAAKLLHSQNPGSIAHTMDTGTFLSNLIKSPEIFPAKKEQEVAQVYVFGFIGHYLLDTRCHPYIYAMTHYNGKTPGYDGRHIRLETDIDTTLLWYFQRRHPSEFHQDESIALTREQIAIVSAQLYYTFCRTYPTLALSGKEIAHAIRCMQKETKLIRDPSGRKKLLIRRLESILTGYPMLSPLIPSDTLIFHKDPCNTAHNMWKNPWSKDLTSTESFFDLFEAAQVEYSRILNDIARFFSKEHTPAEKEHALTLLLRKLGSKSYHSGLASEANLF